MKSLKWPAWREASCRLSVKVSSLSRAVPVRLACRKSEVASTVVALERASLEREARFPNSRSRAV